MMEKTNMRVKIFSHNQNSASSKALADALDIMRLKHKGSKFVARADDLVINWGHAGDALNGFKCRILNHPSSIRNTSNKLSFFTNSGPEESRNYKIPPFTTSKETVIEWLKQGKDVIARTELNGNSGKGIVVISKEEDIVDAPLYTMYIPKKEEYRIHVLGGQVIDVQRKIKDPNKAVTSWYVRNHDSGFIFVRNDVKPDKRVLEYALEVVEAFDLDFGAVDIIFNGTRNEAYVLEINTTPGLEGSSVENYSKAFSAFIKEISK